MFMTENEQKKRYSKMLDDNTVTKYISKNNEFIKYLYERDYVNVVKSLSIYPLGYGNSITFKRDGCLNFDILTIRTHPFDNMFYVKYYNSKRCDLISKEYIKENLDDLLQKLYKGEKVKFNEKD